LIDKPISNKVIAGKEGQTKKMFKEGKKEGQTTDFFSALFIAAIVGAVYIWPWYTPLQALCTKA